MKKNLMTAIIIAAVVLLAVSCETTTSAAPAPAAAPAPSSASADSVLVWFEAESGTDNKGIWVIKDVAEASGGKLIVTKTAKAKESPIMNSSIKYTFNVAKEGKYIAVIRFRAAKDGDGSFFFQINGGSTVHSAYENSSKFQWDYFNNDNTGTAAVFNLKAGENTILIHHREPNTEIDKFLVTDNLTLKAADAEKM